MNHAISATEDTPGGDGPSFIGRYVFPDGELHEVGAVITALHNARLEVRDVESLREHYPPTLRAWVDRDSRLDKSPDQIGVGPGRRTHKESADPRRQQALPLRQPDKSPLLLPRP